MKQIFIFSFIIALSLNINAQSNRPLGARQSGMGGNGVVLSDVWSSFHNQAGLANIKGISTGVYFSNSFNISNMGTKAFAFAMPVVKNGSFGVNYTRFGYSAFSENKFGLAYSMRLGKRLTGGIQIDYFLMQQGLDYGSIGAFAGEIGLMSEPIDNLIIAAHVFNPWSAGYGDDASQKLPTILRVGVGYNFSEKVIFSIEGEKDIDLPAVLRAGVEYNVVAGLFLRTGISTNPVEFAFGAGYNYNNIQLDFSFIRHSILGYYPQFSLNYTFVKKK